MVPLRDTPARRAAATAGVVRGRTWRFAGADYAPAGPRRRLARAPALKSERALSPLRVRGLDRVRLRADLATLAKPASALARQLLAADAGQHLVHASSLHRVALKRCRVCSDAPCPLAQVFQIHY